MVPPERADVVPVDAGLFTHLLGDDAALLPRTTLLTEAYQALLESNHERLAGWFPRAFDVPPTLLTTRTELERSGRAWLDGTQRPLAIAVRSGDQWRLAGWVNLVVDRSGRSAELGYWLDAEFEGLGLASRAAAAVLDDAFGTLGLHRVELQATTDNARSRSVAERLGFTQEGVLREAAAFSEGSRDVAVYGLLAHEWLARDR